MRDVLLLTSRYANIGNELCVRGARAGLHGAQVVPVGMARRDGPLPWHVDTSNAGAVVVVAGVLHRNFDNVWKWVAEEGLPVVLWGVGACWERCNGTHLPRATFDKVRPFVHFAAWRDQLSQRVYDGGGEIALGPEWWYIRDYMRLNYKGGGGALFVNHKNAPFRIEDDDPRGRSMLNEHPKGTSPDPLLREYLTADRVVSSRLHGAMIAAALEVPFAVVPWDLKTVEFVRQWGAGTYVWTKEEALAFGLTERELPVAPVYTRNVTRDVRVVLAACGCLEEP